jgi:predicted DNA binding protein
LLALKADIHVEDEDCATTRITENPEISVQYSNSGTFELLKTYGKNHEKNFLFINTSKPGRHTNTATPTIVR